MSSEFRATHYCKVHNVDQLLMSDCRDCIKHTCHACHKRCRLYWQDFCDACFELPEINSLWVSLPFHHQRAMR